MDRQCIKALVLLQLATLLLLQSCMFSRESASLIDGFHSYQSVQDCRQLFKPPLIWEVVEDQEVVASKLRQQFNILTVSIKHYSSFGIEGELVLHFYNDQLMSTWFYPSNCTEYFQNVEKVKGVTIEPGCKIAIGPHTTLRCAEDYMNRTYIAWEDDRLIKEQRKWLIRNS